RRRCVRVADRGQGCEETGRVPDDKLLAQLGFAGEVVVQSGLGDAQLPGDVGVREAVEPTALYESLGYIEDGRARVARLRRTSQCRHRKPSWNILDTYLLISKVTSQGGH